MASIAALNGFSRGAIRCGVLRGGGIGVRTEVRRFGGAVRDR
jgi:hypothetical protein